MYFPLQKIILYSIVFFTINVNNMIKAILYYMRSMIMVNSTILYSMGMLDLEPNQSSVKGYVLTLIRNNPNIGYSKIIKEVRKKFGIKITEYQIKEKWKITTNPNNKFGGKFNTVEISKNDLKKIDLLLTEYPNIGYSKLYDLFGYSSKVLKKHGITTNNDPIIKKTDQGYISLTKIDPKQKDRLEFNKLYTVEQLKKLKVDTEKLSEIVDLKHGFRLSDHWDIMLDGSDLTFRSDRIANKRKKILKTVKDSSGFNMIKFYGITTRSGIRRVSMIKAKSSGEKKTHWKKVLSDNLDLVSNAKIIIVDSQVNIGDLTDLGKIVFNPKVTNDHPKNSHVELNFSNVKKPIYAHMNHMKKVYNWNNSDKIFETDLNDIFQYVKGIVRMYIYKKLPDSVLMSLKLTENNDKITLEVKI